MLKLIESPNEPPNSAVSEAVVANFLLKCIRLNKSIIGSSGAVPILVRTLKKFGQDQQFPSNARLFESAIQSFHITFEHFSNSGNWFCLISAKYIGGHGSSERILSILSNVVSTPEGEGILYLDGSTLAQKRASRILECLRVDKGSRFQKVMVAVWVALEYLLHMWIIFLICRSKSQFQGGFRGGGRHDE
ncbi:hypothetical protein CK203_090540 [Vitis vinifera]|uniref:Uncharacterized protein n=1 Tax=Vitis vinifera TaxID=29760 RepID=A0A438F2G1_VITVI|nr:hypothetical protein CK203_090540 [Vitis vinifera]